MARRKKDQPLKVDEKQHERLKRVGFQPGQSGNPKGRPTEDAALKAHIRQKLPELIDRLEEIAYNGKNEASVVKAIDTMLSYVLSKASTKHEVDVNLPSFGDFLIQANNRHKKVTRTHTEVIDAEVVEALPIRQDDATRT